MDRDEISIGRFRLDLGRRQLMRDGTPVSLGSRALDILCVLASARGEVVSKDELMTRVWPGLVVEENNIPVHVSALRKALDEGNSGQRYVVTVPGRGYRLVGLTAPAPAPAGDARSGPTLPDKPSIAVLPFQSMSGDPDQEYFADGIVEEIITALSRFSGLFVIARNSSFTYKGRTVDVKQVGRELGVRYLLEGSVRRGGQRVRITGQLIDALTGMHLWADRFDGELEDIFAVQDRVTANVVAAIAPKVEQAEIERAKRKPTDSLDAYDYYLRGKASFDEWTKTANEEALRLFCKAIDRDRDFASAYGTAAMCYSQRKAGGWERVGAFAEPERLARRAVHLGKDDAVALCEGGYTLAHVVGELDTGLAFIDRAVALNPNLAQAWYLGGYVRAWRGEPDAAIEQLTHAMRLSPVDKRMSGMQNGIAFAHFLAGRYDEASAWSEKAVQTRANFGGALRVLAASNALAGRRQQSETAMACIRQLDPTLRLANLKELISFLRPDDLARFAEGLRKAGLPD